MHRALALTPFAALAAGACWRTEPPVHNTSVAAPAPGTIALASIRDFKLGVPIAGRDCTLPAALRTLGSDGVAVRDCGRYAITGAPDDAPLIRRLAAARACAREALAAHQPFVLIWHDEGGDPICDDMAIQNGVDTECGVTINTTTRALLGLRERGGYAIYWIESRRGYSQDSTGPGEVAPLQTDGDYEVERCAAITPVTDESCDGTRPESCLSCEDSEITARCEASP